MASKSYGTVKMVAFQNEETGRLNIVYNDREQNRVPLNSFNKDSALIRNFNAIEDIIHLATDQSIQDRTTKIQITTPTPDNDGDYDDYDEP